MRSRLTRSFPLLVLTLALVLPVLTSSQEPTAPKSENTGTVNQEQPAHESNKAAGQEGKTEAFRHSAAVKALGRITGLDESKAYWLSVVLNFLIVFILLWVMLKKMLPAMFKGRT